MIHLVWARAVMAIDRSSNKIVTLFQDSNNNSNRRRRRRRIHKLQCINPSQTSLYQQGMDEMGGLDSEGRQFKNPDEMWLEEVGDSTKKTQWYNQGIHYWQGVDATVDGVLGGYGQVNDADISASEAFLNTILAERFPHAAKNNTFVALDLLEPVSHFLDAARVNLNPENLEVSDNHKAANFYCVPLQDFTPEPERYDVIWIQWCIGHLADDDFLSFFNRAKIGLKPGGRFVLNENIARNGFVLDKDDKSITRSDLYFKQLFAQCGLHIYKMKDQKGFPGELFAVKMYALTVDMPKRPEKVKSKKTTNRPGIIR